MSCHDETGTCMHVVTRQAHAQAAMSIGGSGQPRWPMAAAAGANPYLYGGMGGAVMGGYGDMQQQPTQQQHMLHGGVPYGSMDAMFGVGGQLVSGVTICLMCLIPAVIQPCIPAWGKPQSKASTALHFLHMSWQRWLPV